MVVLVKTPSGILRYKIGSTWSYYYLWFDRLFFSIYLFLILLGKFQATFVFITFFYNLRCVFPFSCVSVVSKSYFSTSSFLFIKVVTDLVESLISNISATLSFLGNLSELEESELPSKNSSIDKFVIWT